MPRYKLTIEYDGTGYAGWQRQDHMPSIQGTLEGALFKFCGINAEIIGSGRTDAGVHAMAQVAHVDLPKTCDPFRMMQGMNFYLFDSDTKETLGSDDNIPTHRISILEIEEVSDNFHARFSAKQRHYRYHVINRRSHLALKAGHAWRVIEPLNIRTMHHAAQYLIGHHDFSSFRDTKCQAKSPIKTLDALNIIHSGDDIYFEISARSFLHHQVRIMVGTLAMVGKDKWKPEDIKIVLEAKDRTKAGPTAPPDGLFLVRVDY